jgi:O-antigen/teichoic acid export membrane protein
LIPRLYGPSFDQTAAVLSVQIWAGIAVAMSFVHGKWLLAEGLQRYGLVYTLAGAFVNIGLNLILIPRLGVIGAAWATLITQVGLLPIQLFFPKARINFLLMMRTASAPYRLFRRIALVA